MAALSASACCAARRDRSASAWAAESALADAAWLFAAFTASPIRRDVKISRATHLMHLEAGRHALYRETQNFLAGGDVPACVN